MCDSHTWTGRERKPWQKKINPFWWLWNEDEPSNPNFTPLEWWIRNPFHNFTFYVIGLADRNYTIRGKRPTTLSLREDIGQLGWQLAVSMWIFPWVSYSGTRLTWYFGWQPSGKFGIKFNVHSS